MFPKRKHMTAVKRKAYAVSVFLKKHPGATLTQIAREFDRSISWAREYKHWAYELYMKPEVSDG